MIHLNIIDVLSLLVGWVFSGNLLGQLFGFMPYF